MNQDRQCREALFDLIFSGTLPGKISIRAAGRISG
jgi:hypothetical protein